MLACYICGKRCVGCFGPEEDGDGTQRILGEEILGIGLAVDEAEVSAGTGVFAAVGAVANGGGFEVLDGPVGEECGARADGLAGGGGDGEVDGSRGARRRGPEWQMRVSCEPRRGATPRTM